MGNVINLDEYRQSNKLEDDLMTINCENTEWYIDEKQYTTKDMLKKIHSNEL